MPYLNLKVSKPNDPGRKSNLRLLLGSRMGGYNPGQAVLIADRRKKMILRFGDKKPHFQLLGNMYNY
jgi:hypothetical protein